MAGAAGLWFLGAALFEKLASILVSGMRMEPELAFDTSLLLVRLNQLAIEGLWALAPLLVLLVIVAFFSPMLLSGWLISSKALVPDIKRLNPVQGFKRVFSVRGLIELIKAIAKALIIGGVGIFVMWYNKETVLGLVKLPVDLGLSHMSELLGFSFLFIVGAMMLIVAIDVPFQIWEHAKKLRMTKEEVRKETKESEGDPQIKARIRNLQREAARRRMMAEIPKADVVVTNPTHYAVALRYQGESMRAPKVVAKGVHLLAARIRELANENRIPILETPPLARALYHHAELDSEIPETLYTAVAEVLAYVFQLRRYQESGGAMPKIPDDIAIPDGLDQVS